MIPGVSAGQPQHVPLPGLGVPRSTALSDGRGSNGAGAWHHYWRQRARGQQPLCANNMNMIYFVAAAWLCASVRWPQADPACGVLRLLHEQALLFAGSEITHCLEDYLNGCAKYRYQ